ncbi:hypothetical protein PybrP1_006995 [[Pythium] brassicae (nom. inval.)]|nr:hypothetical protein PybrP1_006995 [[Pythium] brassicae (nom. inval.)]
MASDLQQRQGVADYQDQKQFVSELFTSAEGGDLELLKKTVELIQGKGWAASGKEVLVGFKDAHKRSPLHFAAAQGRRKIISYILDVAPECVNATDEEGGTPLFYASKENEFAAVKLLLERGADATLALANGLAPLHEAAANGSIRTCNLLLEHKADLEATTPSGTALHFAVSENREKTVEALVKRGANVDAANAKGVTPLMFACLMNKPVVAKELLAANADLAVAIAGGITALHMAAETGAAEIVRLFLTQRAADSAVAANCRSDAGAVPLQHAAGKGHREVVTLLQPVTSGYESRTDLDALLAAERETFETLYANVEQFPANAAPVADVPQPAEDDIEVPAAVELDADALAQAAALKERGNAAYVAKEYASAVALYSEALAISPADPVLYSNRCAAYLGAGEAAKALHDVRVSKKLKPDWAKALFRESQCLEALEQFEDAASALWAAIQLAPGDAHLEKRFKECVARGRAHHQAKKEKEAAAAAVAAEPSTSA